MRRTIPLLLLGLVTVALAQGRQNPSTENTQAAAKVLIDLENQWVTALVKSDTAALDSLFAESYVDTDEHGQRTGKQGALAVVKSGDLKMQSINLSDMHVNIYGEAAVVIGKAAQVGNYKGQGFDSTIIFTDTFVKQNGRWRAVASHRSTVA